MLGCVRGCCPMHSEHALHHTRGRDESLVTQVGEVGEEHGSNGVRCQLFSCTVCKVDASRGQLLVSNDNVCSNEQP